MSDYNNLTTEQKKTLDDFMSIMRPVSGEIARVCNKIALLIATYNATMGGVVSALDNGSVIPNKTGLAGAQDVTKEDIVAFISAITQVKVGYDTDANREQWIKLAGATNTLG